MTFSDFQKVMMIASKTATWRSFVDAWIRMDGYESNGVHTNGYYGSFYDTTIQSNTNPASVRVISYNTTTISNGVSIQDGTKIRIANAGVYNIQFSAQFDKTDSGTDQVEVWLAKNGQYVEQSNTKLDVNNNNAKIVAAWNFVDKANAGDYYELYWYSLDHDMRIYAEGAATSPVRPAIPSVILTITQV